MMEIWPLVGIEVAKKHDFGINVDGNFSLCLWIINIINCVIGLIILCYFVSRYVISFHVTSCIFRPFPTSF